LSFDLTFLEDVLTREIAANIATQTRGILEKFLNSSKQTRPVESGKDTQRTKDNKLMSTSTIRRKIMRNLWSQLYRRNLASQLDPLERQEQLVRRLMPVLAKTLQGRDKNLVDVKSYQDYLQNVPQTTYDDYRSYVDRIAAGEANVLSLDQTRAFVQTSGTTGYLNKHIPYNEAMIAAAKRYQFAVAATLAAHCPNVDPLFDDRMSYATVVRNTDKMVGQIPKANASELLSAARIPWLSRDRQALTSQVLDAPDWETKLSQITKASIGRDIRVVTGVPLYLKGIFEHVLQTTGARSLKEIWPNIEVIFYSGSGIGPYRETFNQLAGKPLRYFGGYLASEGVFGLPTPDGSSLLFNVNDFLFAFREMSHSQSDNQRLKGIHELELGKEYEILVGCPNGFLNFAVGDVIRIDTLRPYLTYSVLGRNLSINVANEKTSQARIDLVARMLQKQIDAPIEHYFVHPSEHKDALPSYVWTLVCKADGALCKDQIAQQIDELLIQEAPDYRDCRVTDGLIGPVKVQIIPQRSGLTDHLFALNQGRGQYKMKSVYRSAEEFTNALGTAAQKSGVDLLV
jgi:hypothetical protein